MNIKIQSSIVKKYINDGKNYLITVCFILYLCLFIGS